MQPKKHYFAHIPTIAIFIVFAMSAPLGVLLFILKSIDKNAEKEEKAAAQAQADYRSDLGPASAQMAPRQEQDPEALTAPPQNRRALNTGTRPLP